MLHHTTQFRKTLRWYFFFSEKFSKFFWPPLPPSAPWNYGNSTGEGRRPGARGGAPWKYGNSTGRKKKIFFLWRKKLKNFGGEKIPKFLVVKKISKFFGGEKNLELFWGEKNPKFLVVKKSRNFWWWNFWCRKKSRKFWWRKTFQIFGGEKK